MYVARESSRRCCTGSAHSFVGGSVLGTAWVSLKGLFSLDLCRSVPSVSVITTTVNLTTTTITIITIIIITLNVVIISIVVVVVVLLLLVVDGVVVVVLS